MIAYGLWRGAFARRRRLVGLIVGAGFTFSLGFAAPAVAGKTSAGSAGLFRARAVVTQFYTWYTMRSGQVRTSAVLEGPVGSLFDPELAWMLGEEDTDHPNASPTKGYECKLDADPFGTGNGGGRLARFIVGAGSVRGDVYTIPVRLYLAYGRPGGAEHRSAQNVVLAIKNQGGSYKIYDIDPQLRSGEYPGLRAIMARMARDSKCAWSR